MNVALYHPGLNRWAMTERGRSSLTRTPESITIGPSSMDWDGETLRLELNEWTAPIPSRVRGTITLRPEALNQQSYALDASAQHHWRPIAPRARVNARFDDGALSWSGDGYFDSNWGAEPLERGFRNWHWSRAHTRDGTSVFYDIEQRDGGDRMLALRFDKSGAATAIEPPPRTPLPNTFWRVPRMAHGAPGKAPRLVRTLEDAPFYARSQLLGSIDGAPADIMHESLSLDRFRMPIVRGMLPFRMPRIVGRR